MAAVKLPDEARLPGPDRRPESPGLAAAIWMARYAEKRKPTQADLPPLSVFPMTKAAREALRITREGRR